MRRVQISKECADYVALHSQSIEKKFRYCLQILSEQNVVHSKLVKKLVGTEFYELRISTGKEHRIILISVDHDNFNESKRAILLNGFVKKNTTDYNKAIKKARRLLIQYKIEDNE